MALAARLVCQVALAGSPYAAACYRTLIRLSSRLRRRHLSCRTARRRRQSDSTLNVFALVGGDRSKRVQHGGHRTRSRPARGSCRPVPDDHGRHWCGFARWIRSDGSASRWPPRALVVRDRDRAVRAEGSADGGSCRFWPPTRCCMVTGAREFDDDFVVRRWHGVLWLVVVGLVRGDLRMDDIADARQGRRSIDVAAGDDPGALRRRSDGQDVERRPGRRPAPAAARGPDSSSLFIVVLLSVPDADVDLGRRASACPAAWPPPSGLLAIAALAGWGLFHPPPAIPAVVAMSSDDAPDTAASVAPIGPLPMAVVMRSRRFCCVASTT